MSMRLVKMLLCVCGMILALCCKEPYNPPALQNPPSYLVVDGFINVGDSTVITLARTHNINDSVPNVPETGAQIAVVGSSSDSYSLSENASGIYAVDALPLNPAESYRLKITTRDGKQYASDMVPVLQSPPIDSVNWIYNENLGLSIYVSTHDLQNKTGYYRWEYTETWEYHAAFDSYLMYDYQDSQVVYRPNQIFDCWRTDNSTDLLLASSAALSQNVIYQNQLLFVPQGDVRFSVKYSILVKQYALSSDAYNFFVNLKKNTELTGSIFAPLPYQSSGNIHCITNPNEPVLGFINATSVQQERIFISNLQVPTWQYEIWGCGLYRVPASDVVYFFGEMGLVPVDSVPLVYRGSENVCVDCRLAGGTTTKPLFWQ